MTDIEKGCLGTGPLAYQPAGEAKSRSVFDRPFGFEAGKGPCTHREKSFSKKFKEASIYNPESDFRYVYPNTMVWFLFGSNDQTKGESQGHAFYRHLTEQEGANALLLKINTIPDTGHSVHMSLSGAKAITKVLTHECKPQGNSEVETALTSETHSGTHSTKTKKSSPLSRLKNKHAFKKAKKKRNKVINKVSNKKNDVFDKISDIF